MKKPTARGSGWFKPQATIDLHRFTVAESEERLVAFLDQQFLAGREWVLVLHGAKTLWPVVQRIVRSHPLVEDHEPDNTGATRVRLGRRR